MSDPSTYPRLLDILPVDRIPQNFDLIEGVLEEALGKIHYRDFTSFQSKKGDAGNYALKLIFHQSLGISIGGTGGIRLLLNPGATNSALTEVDILLNYRIDALKYKECVTD